MVRSHSSAHRRIRGLTLVDYFGKTMIANLPAEYRVGVIKVAVPGAKIDLRQGSIPILLSHAEEWKKNIANEYGGSPYDYLVELARKAQKMVSSEVYCFTKGSRTPTIRSGPRRSRRFMTI